MTWGNMKLDRRCLTVYGSTNYLTSSRELEIFGNFSSWDFIARKQSFDTPIGESNALVVFWRLLNNKFKRERKREERFFNFEFSFSIYKLSFTNGKMNKFEKKKKFSSLYSSNDKFLKVLIKLVVI